jgi:hypothetical protein
MSFALMLFGIIIVGAGFATDDPIGFLFCIIGGLLLGIAYGMAREGS